MMMFGWAGDGIRLSTSNRQPDRHTHSQLYILPFDLRHVITIIIHLLNDRPLSHRLIVEQFCKNPPIAERGRNCWQRTAKTGEEGKEVINRILLKMSLFSSLCFVCPDQRNTSQFTNSCASRASSHLIDRV